MDIREAIQEARREFSSGEYYSRMRIQEKLMLIESLLPPERETRDDDEQTDGIEWALDFADFDWRSRDPGTRNRRFNMALDILAKEVRRLSAEPATSSEQAPHGKDDDLRLGVWQFDQLCAFVEHARVNGRTIGDTEEAIKIQQMLKQIERQFPTPTQWAYNQACTALHKHADAEKALREALDIAVKACKGMLAISNLWIPAQADDDHRGEAEALHLARDGMIAAVEQAIASSSAPSNKGAPDGPTD